MVNAPQNEKHRVFLKTFYSAGLRLREATHSKRTLRDIMQDISRNAQRRGLTPDILAVDLERKVMRVVLDTNVVVSALLFGASVPGRAFVRVLDRGTILIPKMTVSWNWRSMGMPDSSSPAMPICLP